MKILTVGDGGVITLPEDLLCHLGVTGEATLEFRLLPGRSLLLSFPGRGNSHGDQNASTREGDEKSLEGDDLGGKG